MKAKLASRARGRLHAVIISVLLLGAVVNARAAAGQLDTSFAGTGYTRVGFGEGRDSAAGVAMQQDGKLVVAGRAEDQFGIVRYNSDGSLDLSFGNGGKVVTSFAPRSAVATAVRIQSDGKIVVAGHATEPENAEFVVVRYQPDGSLDTTFHADGKVMTSFGSGTKNLGFALVIQSDGKIVVGGSSRVGLQPENFALVRYLADGSLDTTFDGDGLLLTEMSTTEVDRINALTVYGTQIIAAGFVGGDFAIARYNGNGALDANFAVDGKKRYSIGPGAQAVGVAVQFGNGTILQPDKLVVAGHVEASGGSAYLVVLRLDMAGQPDPSFSGDGEAQAFVTGNDLAAGLVVQGSMNAPRKIVVAGFSKVSPERFCLARFNADGSLDTSFDGDGMVTTSIGSEGDVARAIALQADGRYVVAGSSRNGDDDFAVVRYNVNGSLDTTFSEDGKRTDDVSNGYAGAKAVAVQQDGKIVVGGARDGANDHVLVRLHPDGSLDSSFEVDGKAAYALGSGGAVDSLAVQSDGKIVAAGYTTVNGALRLALFRCLPDGTLDASFNNNGKIVQQIGESSRARAVLVQADGKILLTGDTRVAGGAFTIFVARFDANGALDTTFDQDGIVTTVVGGESYGTAIALQNDGKIVVGGHANFLTTKQDFVLLRYLPNGALDASFDGDGIVSTDGLGGVANSRDYAYAVAIQSNGNIVTAGTSQSNAERFALTRHLPSGAPDISFGNGGKVAVPAIGSDGDSARALLIEPSGKIIVAGTSASDSYRVVDFAAVRLNSDGALDGSFGNAGVALIDLSAGGEDQGLAAAFDSRGRLIVAGEADDIFGVARLTTDLTPTRLANISTRLRVETGDNVLIGGFIVTGAEQKRIIVRALGPSLPVGGRLANPVLELYDGSGTLIASNDNWQDAPNRQEIIDSGIAPPNDLESAILQSVELGPHTAILSGAGGATGVGLVEVYDLGSAQDSKLANISTRGRVRTGDNVMIGGLIITGSSPQKVIVRAKGPSLPVNGRLEDPTLELFNGSGELVALNNNWRDTQEAEINATGIPPDDDREAATVQTLAPGAYTAVIRGANDTTGVALVEVYALDQ